MTDIDTLFDRIQTINSKDPSDLIPEDIDSLVEFFRYRRTRKVSLQTDRDVKGLDEIMPAPKPVKIIPGAVRRFKKA